MKYFKQRKVVKSLKNLRNYDNGEKDEDDNITFEEAMLLIEQSDGESNKSIVEENIRPKAANKILSGPEKNFEPTGLLPGRRIVNLAVIAKKLESCKGCSVPLLLSNCIKETQQGLGVLLCICCKNCGLSNIIPCDTRHTTTDAEETSGPMRCWDINTKLAAAMLNTGLGESQINSLLAQLNIPGISHTALKLREREVGSTIENLAETSCQYFVQKEKELAEKNGRKEHVSIDGGWQKRGTGRNYNSLSLNSQLELSPGRFTGKHFKQRDLKRMKEKETEITKEAKRRKIKLKAERYTQDTMFETCEGDTYCSNIETSADVEEIPPVEAVPEKLNSLPENQIVFDVETNGLSSDDDILSLSAFNVATAQSFEAFITPTKAIPQHITKINGIELVAKGLLCISGKLTNSEDPMVAISKFINFLPYNCILVAHNASFDARMLTAACIKLNIIELLLEKVKGFCDTLSMFKSIFPDQSSYKQVDLVKNLLNKTYNAHNSTSDVTYLSCLLMLPEVSDEIMLQCSFSTTFSIYSLKQLNNKKLHLPSYNNLIVNKVISKHAAEQIAKNGLNLGHLKLAFRRNGSDGLQCILKNRVKQFKLVTNSLSMVFSEE